MSEHPIELLHRELSSLARLYQTRNRDEQLNSGLSVSQTNALFEIAMNDGSLISPLAHKLGLSLSALTKIVDQLESRSLLTRESDPQDRRATRLHLTTAGSRLQKSIHKSFQTHLKTGMRNLSPEELKVLTAGLRTLTRVVDDWQKSAKDR